MSVCLSVFAIAKYPLPGVLDTSGRRAYSENWPVITQIVSSVSMIFCVFQLFRVFGLSELAYYTILQG